MLLKWETFVNIATSSWGSGRAIQKSKSVCNIKPPLAVKSGRLRKQEAPHGEKHSSYVFALLFLHTEPREQGALSNQNLRFLDTPFPGGFHIQRTLKNQIRKWKKVWKQMGILDPRAAMLLSWLEQHRRLTLGFLINEHWLGQHLSEGMKGSLSFVEEHSGKEAEMAGCQQQ